MRNKYSIDKVSDIANEIGFKLLNTNYKNNKQELILVDKEGYFYISCLSYLLLGQYPSKFGNNNPYTIQNIKLWCVINQKNFYLVDNPTFLPAQNEQPFPL